MQNHTVYSLPFSFWDPKTVPATDLFWLAKSDSLSASKPKEEEKKGRYIARNKKHWNANENMGPMAETAYTHQKLGKDSAKFSKSGDVIEFPFLIQF